MDSQLCRTRMRTSFHQISRTIGWTNSRRWISWLVTWHWLVHGRIKQSWQAWSSLGAVQSKKPLGRFTKQITNSTGPTLVRIPPRRRLCFNRGLHESLVQRCPNSEFPYPARRSPHAADIFFGKMWQFGQIRKVHKWTLNLNRRRMASSRPHSARWRPSAILLTLTNDHF